MCSMSGWNLKKGRPNGKFALKLLALIVHLVLQVKIKYFFLCVTKSSLTCRGHRIAVPEVILYDSSHFPIHSTDQTVFGTGCSDQTDDLVC